MDSQKEKKKGQKEMWKHVKHVLSVVFNSLVEKDGEYYPGFGWQLPYVVDDRKDENG